MLNIFTPHRRAFEKEVDKLMDAYLRAGGATHQYCAEEKLIRMERYDWGRKWATAHPKSQQSYGYIPAGDYADWARKRDREAAARRYRMKAQTVENRRKALEKVVHHYVNGSGGCFNKTCYACWKEMKTNRRWTLGD